MSTLVSLRWVVCDDARRQGQRQAIRAMSCCVGHNSATLYLVVSRDEFRAMGPKGDRDGVDGMTVINRALHGERTGGPPCDRIGYPITLMILQAVIGSNYPVATR
jgi:hypothetical protein